MEYKQLQKMLKIKRNNKNISQKELAEVCDVSEKTINRAENEAEKLNYETLLKLANTLEIEIEDYIYTKAYSLDKSWEIIETISKKIDIKIHPVKYNITLLDIAIRIVEIIESNLENKSNSIKLRHQRLLIIEYEKLKKLNGVAYYTIFIENENPVLNIYFLENVHDNKKNYIEVTKKFIKNT